MEISSIRSKAEFINYLWEKDKNSNDKLEKGEIPESEIKLYDINSDNEISAWEIMEAVNKNSPAVIFSTKEIQDSKNDLFVSINFKLTDETIICGVELPAGTEGHIVAGSLEVNAPKDLNIDGVKYKKDSIKINKNGRVESGKLAEDTTIGGKKYSGGTYLSFDENGRVYSAYGDYVVDVQRGFRLLPIISFNGGVEVVQYGSLPDDVRQVPPHPGDKGAVTDPIESGAGVYFHPELNIGLKVDLWQYLYLKYEMGFGSNGETDNEIKEGGYAPSCGPNRPCMGGGYPPEHRQRYASGENAYTFISKGAKDKAMELNAHYLTLGFAPYRRGLAQTDSHGLPENKYYFEHSFNLEAGGAVKKFSFVRGWDRYASVEVKDYKEVDFWGVVLGANYQWLGAPKEPGPVNFLYGITAGLRATVFPQGAFNVTANLGAIIPGLGF